MKKKEFSLSGILKIRKYRENLALLEFQNKTQEDRSLAMKYENLSTEIDKNVLEITKSENTSNLEQVSNLYNYIAHCNSMRKQILGQREAIRPEVDKARDEYNKVRLELESIKILENAHLKDQKKLEQKLFYEQIQEGVILK